MIMTQYFVATAALLLGTIEAESQEPSSWTAAMQQAKPKVAPIRKPILITVRSADPQIPTEGEKQALIAMTRRNNEAYEQALRFYDGGRFADATARIEAYIATGEFPGQPMQALLIDCYGALGAWGDAYRYLSTFIENEADTSLLLRAVLVSGKCGVVLQGQLRYANEEILRWHSGYRDYARAVLPWDDTPGSLIFSSTLAIGDEMRRSGRYRESIKYNRMALTESRDNWVAQLQLGKAFFQSQQYAEAVPLLQRVRDRNHPGLLRQDLDNLLYMAREHLKRRN